VYSEWRKAQICTHKKSQPKLTFLKALSLSGFLTTAGSAKNGQAEAEEGQGAGLGYYGNVIKHDARFSGSGLAFCLWNNPAYARIMQSEEIVSIKRWW